MTFAHKETIKPPEYLHYYRPFDEFAKDILQNKRLYLKSALDFNDPFDCSAFSLRIGSSAYYKKQFTSDLKKDSISETQKQRIREILANKTYIEPDFWNGIAAGMQSQINKFGIFSFCVRPDNFLLWSHYANKHKGICFVFHMPFMPTDLCRLLKVRYRKTRPVINYSSQKDYHLIFDIKSSIWKYEDEWRCVVPNRAREHISFGEKSLFAIICGIGISENERQDIIQYCTRYDNKPSIYQALRAQSQYRIQIAEIKYQAEERAKRKENAHTQQTTNS